MEKMAYHPWNHLRYCQVVVVMVCTSVLWLMHSAKKKKTVAACILLMTMLTAKGAPFWLKEKLLLSVLGSIATRMAFCRPLPLSLRMMRACT
jgi:hypothetical protein